MRAADLRRSRRRAAVNGPGLTALKRKNYRKIELLSQERPDGGLLAIII
jgi:hypothetical protein